MGNSLFKCFTGNCFGEEQSTPTTQENLSVSALAQDLFNFELTSQVPQELSGHVVASKKAQANWYRKLHGAWNQTQPTPNTPEAAAAFVVKTLHKHPQSDVESLLAYYGLPYPTKSSGTVTAPPGVRFQLDTLPVDPKAVTDGDGIKVYVDTTDPRESADVPTEVHEAAIERREARSAKNFKKADKLNKTIRNAGYRVINGQDGEEILAKEYRIRLRGIDAPESLQPYGKEAKDELCRLVQGKRLKIHAYNYDQFARCVADVYCNRTFVQEHMLRRGFAWHFAKYDQRPEFAKWQNEARAACRGLWALSEPEKPWEWRKRNEGWREGNSSILVH